MPRPNLNRASFGEGGGGGGGGGEHEIFIKMDCTIEFYLA